MVNDVLRLRSRFLRLMTAPRRTCWISQPVTPKCSMSTAPGKRGCYRSPTRNSSTALTPRHSPRRLRPCFRGLPLAVQGKLNITGLWSGCSRFCSTQISYTPRPRREFMRVGNELTLPTSTGLSVACLNALVPRRVWRLSRLWSSARTTRTTSETRKPTSSAADSDRHGGGSGFSHAGKLMIERG